MKRILFVDGDSAELLALQRQFADMRAAWEMLFVQSAASAFRLLEQGPFDAVVSDLTVSGTDGERILSETRHHSPNAMRIMLSHSMERSEILRAMEVAHQHFAKPEALLQLKDALLRAFALQALLKNEAVKQLIAQIQSLPSIPGLYKEILIELTKEAPSISQISAIISKDIALCTKILQVVNSTFFGLPRNISNPEEAVAYLGLETIKSLVLSVQVFSLFGNLKVKEFSADDLWTHSLFTARAVRAISVVEARPVEEADLAFTAGLLHDVGKLVLVAHLEGYGECWRAARQGSAPLWEIEREKLGASHAEVGACLLSTWGLPHPIVEAVAFHHQPQRAGDRLFSAVTAVHAANVLVKESRHTNGSPSPDFDFDYLRRISAEDRLPLWQEAISKLSGRAGTTVSPGTRRGRQRVPA